MWTNFNAYVENEAITKASPKKTKGRMYNFIKDSSILFWSIKLLILFLLCCSGRK